LFPEKYTYIWVLIRGVNIKYTYFENWNLGNAISCDLGTDKLTVSPKYGHDFGKFNIYIHGENVFCE
jgi:hypothetical protein